MAAGDVGMRDELCTKHLRPPQSFIVASTAGLANAVKVGHGCTIDKALLHPYRMAGHPLVPEATSRALQHKIHGGALS